MKYLTPEEAQEYISTKDDILGREAAYYTLIPSIEEGWEDVIYYTNRKKFISSIESEGRYWIYVLSNESIPDLIKIGYTSTPPEERAKEISRATGVALPYKVEFVFKCHEGMVLEKEIHSYLDEYRVNDWREFFKISINEAKDIITKIGEKYK